MLARFGQSDYIKNIPIGSVTAGVAMHTERPLFIVNPHISLNVLVKELAAREFPLAEEVWLGYHQQKADPAPGPGFWCVYRGHPCCCGPVPPAPGWP